MNVKHAGFDQPKKCTVCGHPTLYVLEDDWRVPVCPICVVNYIRDDKPKAVTPEPVKKNNRNYALPKTLSYLFTCGHKVAMENMPLTAFKTGKATLCPVCRSGKIQEREFLCQKEGCGKIFSRAGGHVGMPIYCDECSATSKKESYERACQIRKERRNKEIETKELKRYPYPPLNILDFCNGPGNLAVAQNLYGEKRR